MENGVMSLVLEVAHSRSGFKGKPMDEHVGTAILIVPRRQVFVQVKAEDLNYSGFGQSQTNNQWMNMLEVGTAILIEEFS